MATDRKHLAVHLDQELYEALDKLRFLDSRKRVITMSKYAGRIIAEYVSRERWRLEKTTYSIDTDFE